MDFWHSQWRPVSTKYPHSLIIDFTRPTKVAKVIYQGRRGGNGHIKDYEIYLSADGRDWGQPAASGSFNDKPDKQFVLLHQLVTARFLKLVALNETKSQDFATVAKLDIEPAE